MKNSDQSTFKLNTIKSFPLACWLLIMIFLCFYSSIFPFNSMLPDYLKIHLKFDKDLASNMSSVIYLLSVIGAPFFGKMIDVTKHHPIWSLSATTCLGLSHFIWGWMAMIIEDQNLLKWVLFGLNLFNGVCYSIMASTISPWVGKMMPMKLKATAFGLLYGFQNLGIGASSYLLGVGVDKLGWDYFPFLCGIISFIAAGFSLIVVFVEGVDPWESYEN